MYTKIVESLKSANDGGSQKEIIKKFLDEQKNTQIDIKSFIQFFISANKIN